MPQPIYPQKDFAYYQAAIEAGWSSDNPPPTSWKPGDPGPDDTEVIIPSAHPKLPAGSTYTDDQGKVRVRMRDTPVKGKKGGKVLKGKFVGGKYVEGEQGADPTPKSKPSAANLNVISAEVPTQTVVAPLTSVAAPSPLAQLLQRSVEVQAASTKPHIIVMARAGSGKTFTLVVGVAYMFRDKFRGVWEQVCQTLGFTPTPSPQQQAVWDAMRQSVDVVKTIQFTAFNKSIVTEFERTWSWLTLLLQRQGIRFAFNTMHSLGNRVVCNAYGRLEVTKWNVQNIIAEMLETDYRMLKRQRPSLVEGVDALVRVCKMNLVDDDSPIMHGDGNKNDLTQMWWDDRLDELARHYDIDIDGSRRDIFNLVPRVLKRCKAPNQSMDYNDQIWLPVVNKLAIPKFDLLLVDESQDLNKCQQAIVKEAGRRVIVCGDPKQAIYGFAGADAMSMKRLEEDLGASKQGCMVLPLTVTRRCGKAIVAEANQVVPDFQAHESNSEGKIDYANFKDAPGLTPRPGVTEGQTPSQTYHKQVEDGDMVLCRVNAPLVTECFKFLKAGRKATIRGRDDVASGLCSTIDRMDVYKTVDLVARITDWCAGEVAKESAKRNPCESRIIGIQDRTECICAFAEGTELVEEVKKKIMDVFTDEKQPLGIRLSSIHKAKGLEADRVFILQTKGGSVPHPSARTAWQQEQERNLLYVAITRAKHVLTYVVE